MQTNEEIKIRGEFTDDPAVCRFVVNRSLLPDWTVVFSATEDSGNSPLIDALFGIEGIAVIKIQDNTLTLTKNIPDPWPKLAARMIPVLKEALNKPPPWISEKAIEKSKTLPPEKEMKEVIETLFEQHINPSIASHGGWVRLAKIEGANVFVEMGGGCQGCSASKATLKNGIEQAIREALPQVREVIDITDHTAGENPYYS